MPCMGPSDAEIAGEYRQELDRTARILCDVLTKLEKGDVKLDKLLTPEGQKWWTNHKAQDARQLAAERAKKAESRLQKAAMRKLSPEERKALGLDNLAQRIGLTNRVA